MNEECSFLSFIFLQYDLSDCEKNAEEQLLLCFNYSPNYHDNLVTLSQVLEQKTPAPDRTNTWSFYLTSGSVSVNGARNFLSCYLCGCTGDMSLPPKLLLHSASHPSAPPLCGFSVAF